MIELLKSITRGWWWLARFFIWLITAHIASYAVIVLPFNPDPPFAKTFERYATQYEANPWLPFLIHLASLAGSLLAYLYVVGVIEEGSVRRNLKLDVLKVVWGSNMGFVIMIIGVLILTMFGLISLSFTSLLPLPRLILIFTMVAVSEEVVFRGYILRNMLARYSKWFSILFSSLLFAALHVWNLHFGIVGFINIFLGGVLLAIAYLKHDNLSLPIGLHFSWNLAQAIFGFAVSGQKDPGVFSTQYLTGNDLLTGGAFGLEGSIMLIPVVLVAILLLAKKEFLNPTVNL